MVTKQRAGCLLLFLLLLVTKHTASLSRNVILLRNENENAILWLDSRPARRFLLLSPIPRLLRDAFGRQWERVEISKPEEEDDESFGMDLKR